MDKQTQISLLRDRLKKIRKNKRNATILSLAVSFMIAIATQQLYGKDFLFGFAVWLAIGVLFALAIMRHYNYKEIQVRWQIIQLTRR
jgi:preprotein translocase subunit SecD